MRIEKYFYRDRDKRLELVRKELLEKFMDDDEYFERAVKQAFEWEHRKNAEKTVYAECFTLGEYEAIESALLGLAEKIQLDFTSDLMDDIGLVTLSAPNLFVNSHTSPQEHAALFGAMASADRFCINSAPENGEDRVCLSLFYDLAR